MKFGVRSLVEETKSLKSSFFLTLSSKIIAKTPEFKYFVHFCNKNLHILRIAKNYVVFFSFFSK